LEIKPGNYKFNGIRKAMESERPDLEELLGDIDKLERIVAEWDEEKRLTVIALLMSIDTLHREAFARLVAALKEVPAAGQVLEDTSQDEVVNAVMRHFGLIAPALAEKVERALDTVRPALATHGGGVQLVAIEPPGTAVISLTGACQGCPASAMTLSEGVEKTIKEHCPEITEIKKVVPRGAGPSQVPVDIKSPFAPGNHV
jgi:Fe-S cluster biogenesis protein NfuA